MAQTFPLTTPRVTPAPAAQPTLLDLYRSSETTNQLLRDLIALYRPSSNEWRAGALITGQVLKNSPGVLYNISGFNNSGSIRFLQFFDMVDTIPPEGAVPTLVYQVALSVGFSFDIGGSSNGRKFDQGIVFVSSSTGPTKTITATADIWLNARLS